MTYQDLLLEIPKLSFQERIALMKALADSLGESPRDPAQATATVYRLFGALAGAGTSLTDADIEQIRDEYLAEKY